MRDVEHRSERLELITTVLLGIATAASAWCTYEAQLWSSRQLRDMGRATALNAASLEATEIGSRETSSDVMAFAAEVEAEMHGDQRASRYIAEVARPAFRGPLQAWLDQSRAAGRPAPTPFDDPTYRAAIAGKSNALRAEADRSLAAAALANSNGDLFVMRTVMFATSLFFLGIAGQLRTTQARRLILALGAVVLMLSLLSLTRLKRAGRPQRGEAGASALEDGVSVDRRHDLAAEHGAGSKFKLASGGFAIDSSLLGHNEISVARPELIPAGPAAAQTSAVPEGVARTLAVATPSGVAVPAPIHDPPAGERT